MNNEQSHKLLEEIRDLLKANAEANKRHLANQEEALRISRDMAAKQKGFTKKLLLVICGSIFVILLLKFL